MSNFNEKGELKKKPMYTRGAKGKGKGKAKRYDYIIIDDPLQTFMEEAGNERYFDHVNKGVRTK